MKKALNYLASGILLSGMLFASCTEKNAPEAGTLGFAEGASITLGAEPKEFTLNVQNWSEEMVWDLNYTDGDAGWLEVSYNEEGVFSVRMHKNHAAVERSAEISLMTTFEEAAFRIVQQAGDGEDYDPFLPDFPDDYFLYSWNDNWTIWNWIYEQGHNSDPKRGKLKYDSINYGENGLKWHDFYFWLYPTSGKMSVGLKLSEELLAEVRGKLVSQIALQCTTSKIRSAKLSVVTLKKSDSQGLPAWCKDDSWSVDKVIFEQEMNPQDRKDWLFLDLPDHECERIPADAENVMILATIDGDGTINATDGMLWAAPQPISRFAPTYINPDNNEGRDMYRFSGGTVSMNFVWVNVEQLPEE